MLKHIATWNTARDVWERPHPDPDASTETDSLSCGHWGVYWETFPTSGMTAGGMAFELPTWASRISDSESSSLQLLPTPEANTASNGGSQHPDKRRAGGALGEPAGCGGALLPTPKVTDDHPCSPGDARRKSPGLRAIAFLLPTPVVNDMGDNKSPEWWADFLAKHKASGVDGNGHGKSLAMEMKMLPTPRVTQAGYANDGRGGRSPDVEARSGGQDWAQYEEAIRRQESVMGRPAPSPTEPGRTRPKLSPRFTEWLMGLPDGWITDVPSITRPESLKACGNGVVPQQCEAALSAFLQDYATMHQGDDSESAR